MSLLSASPSTRNRTTRRGDRSDLGHHGAPRLRLVQESPRSTAVRQRSAPVRRPAARRPARPVRFAPAPAVARPEPALRLTRRGRIVVRAAVSFLAVLAVAVGVLSLDRPAQAGSQSHPLPVTYHVVLPGETLWQIAGEVAPKADRRDTVAHILDLNALSTAAVSPGQRIAVPVVPTS